MLGAHLVGRVANDKQYPFSFDCFCYALDAVAADSGRRSHDEEGVRQTVDRVSSSYETIHTRIILNKYVSEADPSLSTSEPHLSEQDIISRPACNLNVCQTGHSMRILYEGVYFDFPLCQVLPGKISIIRVCAGTEPEAGVHNRDV